jgi:hypothetical protein
MSVPVSSPIRLSLAVGCVVVLVSAMLLSEATPRAQAGRPERYSAVAVNFHAPTGAGVTPVDLIVRRWTTDAERDAVFTLFTEKGQEALIDRMRQMPSVGSIQVPGSVGYDIRFATRTISPGGLERIMLVTDRPIGFAEASSQGRTLDYPFSVIEMRVGSDGRGEGRLTIATKFMFDPGTRTMVLENYNDVPVRLQSVRKEK